MQARARSEILKTGIATQRLRGQQFQALPVGTCRAVLSSPLVVSFERAERFERAQAVIEKVSTGFNGRR